jgi:hypothetical protein
MKTQLTECTDPAGLWRHYDGQTERQSCYIELGLKDGVLLADWDAIVGSGTPSGVYHGFDRRWGIPCLTADAANRVLWRIAPLADRMLADWEEQWDGNNMVAVLGEDAQAAEEEIEELLGLPTEGNLYEQEPDQGFDESDLVAVWGIDGVTNSCEASEYGITADTTDERLGEIEQEILSDLGGPSGVAVCHGLYDYLRELRDRMKSDA